MAVTAVTTAEDLEGLQLRLMVMGPCLVMAAEAVAPYSTRFTLVPARLTEVPVGGDLAPAMEKKLELVSGDAVTYDDGVRVGAEVRVVLERDAGPTGAHLQTAVRLSILLIGTRMRCPCSATGKRRSHRGRPTIDPST